MKKLMIFFVLIALSCTKEEDITYYSYNGTIVTRLDKDNKINLYYGKFTNFDTLNKESSIEATINGFDGMMSAYLIFNDDKTVSIIPISSLLEKKGDNMNLNIKDFNNNIDFINWERKIRGKYDNIYKLSDIKEIEVEINRENNSKIEVTSSDR